MPASSVRILDFDVTVDVDNEPLPEYDAEVNLETRRGVCWIEAVAGQRFTVNFTRSVGGSYGSVTGWVYLDAKANKVQEGRFLLAPGSVRLDGMTVSATELRPFLFSDIVRLSLSLSYGHSSSLTVFL